MIPFDNNCKLPPPLPNFPDLPVPRMESEGSRVSAPGLRTTGWLDITCNNLTWDYILRLTIAACPHFHFCNAWSPTPSNHHWQRLAHGLHQVTLPHPPPTPKEIASSSKYKHTCITHQVCIRSKHGSQHIYDLATQHWHMGDSKHHLSLITSGVICEARCMREIQLIQSVKMLGRGFPRLRHTVLLMALVGKQGDKEWNASQPMYPYPLPSCQDSEMTTYDLELSVWVWNLHDHHVFFPSQERCQRLKQCPHLCLFCQLPSICQCCITEDPLCFPYFFFLCSRDRNKSSKSFVILSMSASVRPSSFLLQFWCGASWTKFLLSLWWW